MKKVIKALTSIENVIMFVTLAIMVICSFAQVVNRNFFKLPIAWFDEASTYCMIYAALIGTEMGLRDGTQISITAIVDKFNGRKKSAIEFMAKVVILVFSVTILISAVKMVGTQVSTGQVSAALHMPMAIPYAALVISFAMIVLVQGVAAIEKLGEVISGKSENDETVQDKSQEEEVGM